MIAGRGDVERLGLVRLIFFTYSRVLSKGRSLTWNGRGTNLGSKLLHCGVHHDGHKRLGRVQLVQQPIPTLHIHNINVKYEERVQLL